MLKAAPIAALGIVLLLAGPAAAASAAGPVAVKPVAVRPVAVKTAPNACKTFTNASANKLFGVSRRTHLARKLTTTGTGHNKIFICTVQHHGVRLRVQTSLVFGGFGGPYKCHKYPTLGAHGQVCYSDLKSLQSTLAFFDRHKVVFFDSYNKTLPHKGAKMYHFALAQYRRFKG